MDDRLPGALTSNEGLSLHREPSLRDDLIIGSGVCSVQSRTQKGKWFCGRSRENLFGFIKELFPEINPQGFPQGRFNTIRGGVDFVGHQGSLQRPESQGNG